MALKTKNKSLESLLTSLHERLCSKTCISMECTATSPEDVHTSRRRPPDKYLDRHILVSACLHAHMTLDIHIHIHIHIHICSKRLPIVEDVLGTVEEHFDHRLGLHTYLCSHLGFRVAG